MPQFLRAHSPAYEGGGNDAPATTTTIDALKGKQTKTTQKQKKRKKHSSEAWTEIQQKNYTFSGDSYILQSHRNEFIPFKNVEEEEPAEFQKLHPESEEEEVEQDSEEDNEVLEEELSEEEEDSEAEEEEEEEAEDLLDQAAAPVTPPQARERRPFTPESENEEFSTPTAKTPNPRTPARTTRPPNLDQLLFRRLTRSQGAAPEVSVPISCLNCTQSEKHLTKGTSRVYILPGCRAHLSTHLIISDISIKLDTDLLHFKWKWDAISLDGLDSNIISPQLALLEENGLFRPTLSDLHELKLHQKQGLHWWTTLANFVGNPVMMVLFFATTIYLAFHFHRFQQSQKAQAVPTEDDKDENQ